MGGVTLIFLLIVSFERQRDGQTRGKRGGREAACRTQCPPTGSAEKGLTSGAGDSSQVSQNAVRSCMAQAVPVSFQGAGSWREAVEG